MKEWIDYTKKELLQLPLRNWNIVSKYDSVLFVNTRIKHDSGFNLFALVGCEGYNPKEIIGYMDDFRFDCYGKNKQFYDKIMMSDIAFDCSMKGVFRMHSKRKICVGWSVSTTNWWLEDEKR